MAGRTRKALSPVAAAALVTLLLILPQTSGALQPGAYPETQPVAGTSGSADSNHPSEDDFAPALLVIVLAMGAVFLVLVGVGIAIGAVLVGLLAILVVAGILSSSALIGLAKKRVGPAVRAMVIQLGAVAGAPCGMALFWLGVRLFHLGIPLGWTLLAGGLCGLAGGAALAWVAIALVVRLANRIARSA